MLNLIAYPRTTRVNKPTKRYEKSNVWDQHSILYEKSQNWSKIGPKQTQHVNKVYMNNYFQSIVN